MLRLIILILIGFAVLLGLYSFWRNNLAKDPGSHRTIFHPALKYYLVLTGFLIGLVCFGYFMIKKDQAPTKTYHPPQYKEGRIIPGYFE